MINFYIFDDAANKNTMNTLGILFVCLMILILIILLASLLYVHADKNTFKIVKRFRKKDKIVVINNKNIWLFPFADKVLATYKVNNNITELNFSYFNEKMQKVDNMKVDFIYKITDPLTYFNIKGKNEVFFKMKITNVFKTIMNNYNVNFLYNNNGDEKNSLINEINNLLTNCGIACEDIYFK